MIEFSLTESAEYADDRIFQREAVRAVIFQGSRLLMIHSRKAGDYKFPGGGREPGESREETLIREVREECGARVSMVGRRIGKVIEERPAFDEIYDRFIMTSYYYLCMVEEGDFSRQELDDYERDLDFTPVWISGEEALERNRAIIARGGNIPPWTRRETRFLNELLSGE